MTEEAKVSRALNYWMESVKTAYSAQDADDINSMAAEKVAMLNQASGAMNTPGNMQVTGSEDVAAQQSALFQAQKTNGPTSNEAVENMLAAPATGLMHVSDLARIANNWSPVILSNDKANSIAYQNYVNQLVRFPLVTLNYAQRQNITRTTSSWSELINSIADTFVGIASQDKQAIVNGLKSMANAASSTMSTEQRTSLFCQNAINAANGVYEFYLYNSTCTFWEEQGKGFHTMQSEFDVLQVKLTLVMPLWTRQNVAAIIGQTEESLDEWLKNNSSKEDETAPPIPWSE